MRTHNIIAGGCFPELNSKSRQTIELLCAAARKGLAGCYSKKDFFRPSLSFHDHEIQLNMTSNLRYIIMAQIGIKRWLHFCGNDDASLPDFWEHIVSRSHEINNAGDLGLAIWAGVEGSADDCTVFTGKLVNSWSQLRETCNAVELAWVVQGMARLSQRQSMTGEKADVLRDAYDRLIDLYCRDTALFARHCRRGFQETISRRVACFADQVYPILALANYGHAFRDDKGIDVALAVADKLCRLQGPRGQWWWHYDVKTGTVAEEYPVFSVHQDAMAPMALLAVDKIAGTNHSAYLEKGLMWLNKRNELNATMLMLEQGIIWRDIHRKEIGKMYRIARDALITVGWYSAHRLAGTNLFGYGVNRECRPYHLGWILYAWAGHLQKPNVLPDNALSNIGQ